jgi:hypothetical protein
VDTPLPARVLRSMFVYRHRQLAADLAALARARSIYAGPLTVAVTLLESVDAVIHLAGASIGGRFTAERKDEIGPAGSCPPGAWPSWQHLACTPSSRRRPSASTVRTAATRS